MTRLRFLDTPPGGGSTSGRTFSPELLFRLQKIRLLALALGQEARAQKGGADKETNRLRERIGDAEPRSSSRISGRESTGEISVGWISAHQPPEEVLDTAVVTEKDERCKDRDGFSAPVVAVGSLSDEKQEARGQSAE